MIYLQGSISNLSRLILTNVVHLKANWKRCFDVAKTSKKRFRLDTGETIDTDMMNSDKTQFQWLDIVELGAKAILLPFTVIRIY